MLRASLASGVGAIGLVLVGCGGGEEAETELTPSGSAAEQQGGQAGQDAAGGRQSRGAVISEDAEQEEDGAARQAQAEAEDRSEQNVSATAQSEKVADPPGDVVDPLEWREQYHWRKLARLHEPARAPTVGGTLTIESDAVATWDPLAAWDPELEAAQSGHLLPLVYSRLVEMDVSDRSDAHRTLVQGDLAVGWEWLDPTTLSFSLRPGVHWPEGSPSEGRALDAADVASSYDVLREPGRRQAPIYDAVERIEADGVDGAVARWRFIYANRALHS